MLRQAVILVFLTVVAAAATHFFHPRAPVWHLTEEPLLEDEMSLALIREKFPDRVLWIDARPADQYAKGHIPGAILLNEQGFQDQVAGHLETLQKAVVEDRAVIVYCGGEACKASRKVLEQLTRLIPIENAYVLKGGWPAWQAAKAGN
jgi:rhodanese-related sulfurtransferase